METIGTPYTQYQQALKPRKGVPDGCAQVGLTCIDIDLRASGASAPTWAFLACQVGLSRLLDFGGFRAQEFGFGGCRELRLGAAELARLGHILSRAVKPE